MRPDVAGAVADERAEFYIGTPYSPDSIPPYACHTSFGDAGVLVLIEKRFYLGVGVAFACARL